MANTAPSMDTVPSNAYAFNILQFSNSDQSTHNLPAAHSEGSWAAGSLPCDGAMGGAIGDHPGYPRATEEHAHPGADGEVAVECQSNECDKVPCPSRSEGKKGSRKRGRDWTDEETRVLVDCKRAFFEDKGSRYRKQKSSATNWDAIAEAVRENPDAYGASGKTGDQCRLRWDTLVKSHRLIKERCMASGKEYAEVMAEDKKSLKLATTLKPEWYEVIDSISGNAQSRKQSNPSARKSKNGGAGDGLVSGGMARTEAGSHTLVMEGGSVLGTGSILAAPGCPGMSMPRHEAVQRFQSLGPQLRSTLLDIILSERYLSEFGIDESLSRECEWLSAVQSRSRSDVYNDEKLFSGRDLMTPHQIGVLTLCKCKELESIDMRGLGKLRSLIIMQCSALKEITGWKYLRELGWLEIHYSEEFQAYVGYPDLRDLPTLRVCILNRDPFLVDQVEQKFDISQCVRLRRLEIRNDNILEESEGLSSLKCLEELIFWCFVLLSIDGLSKLHSLTRLELVNCHALRSLPDIGHLKELVHINIGWSDVEEIPGIEKLVSLKTLDCYGSMLKHLPNLHHLPELQYIVLDATPLIEDDPSSFYFDKPYVSFKGEEKSVLVDVTLNLE